MRVDSRLKIVEGDITKLMVDCIVNAANRTLLGGGGVDGAIHRSAGPDLLSECRVLGGCLPGEAKITGGYQLPAPWVIHTVGPIWNGGKANESATLERCYISSLEIASEKKLANLAFPAISTGAYRFPPGSAARIALKSVRSFTEQNSYPREVIFCCFDTESVAHHQRALG